MRAIIFGLVLTARLAFAADAFYILYAPGGAATTVSATANQMWCATVVSPYHLAAGLFNAYGVITAACSSGTFGWAVYPDSDSAAPIISWTAACTSAGITTGTASPSGFPIQDNAPYRLCFCSSTSADGTFLQSAGTISTLMNAFTTKVGHATNACTSGTPPSSTGALIADTAVGVPFMKLE